MSFASIVYLPPTRLYPTDAFMQNMRNFPAKHPLYFFTDEYENKGSEEIIKLNGKVEVAKDPKNKLAVNNLIFYTAMRIAASKQLTYVLLLENDCRVGVRHWDDIIFQEMLSKNCEAICAGTMMIFNPSCYNRVAAENFERFLSKTLPSRPCPLSITGSSNLAEKRDTAVFPNGAFAIYKLDWLLKAYPEIIGQGTTINLARKTRTWDYAISDKLWAEFHEGVYDKVVHLDSIYSGYGNIMSTEDERKQWLIEGKVVGVHQIKSDWPGPEPKPEADLIEVNPASEVPASVQKQPQSFSGSMEIFIVTYAKDFPYLKYCLRSIKKFAQGFSGVTILVPTKDAKECRKIAVESGLTNFTIKWGYEWAKKGMVWHMAQVCRADEWCPKADYIAHFDADCVFTGPVSPMTFFMDGKPLLRYEPFSTIAIRHHGVLNWKIAAENALPFAVNDETMRGHPFLGRRELYAATRKAVEEKTGLPFNDYVKSTKNEYVQTFCEFVTLGNVALKYFRDDYCCIDLSKTANPDRSPYPVFQAWSHNPPNVETELWMDGTKRKMVPLDYFKQLGIA